MSSAKKSASKHPHFRVSINLQRMNKTNSKVDGFLKHSKQWRAEFEELRKIILGCQLAEELKWGWPCYTFDKKNVVLMHGFKEYCALLFFKGALLKDPNGLLIQQTENVQSARQIRFNHVREIVKRAPVLKAYVRQAIAAEKAGLKVTLKKPSDLGVPDELQAKLDHLPALKEAFSALTPGRQRAYVLNISAAKQAKTRAARVDKWMPRILDGKGMDDE
jgi:uncharacterized protein YdeI (YjbR/CyaY-like superfamily)